MRPRLILATLFASLAGLAAGAATAAAAPDRPPVPPPTTFWQDKGFMNMAHQGGELEAPGNTLYAFKTAIRDRGADVLEMDGYLTADGKFVITHDLSPAPTSNIAETPLAGKTVSELTLAQLKTLDFAWKYTPGKGHYGYDASDPHPYRGVATDEVDPPPGYTADDFKIATLEEVLAAFPDTPLNVDMKAPRSNEALADEAAVEVARIMNAHPDRSEDVIIASFFQGAMEKFHELAPGHKALSASEEALLGYISGSPVTPTPVAAQPPDLYGVGSNPLRTVPALIEHTEHDGYALHVWGSGKDPAEDTPPFYRRLIEEGADGFFTQVPSQLHQFLCEEGIPRPDGSARCASQECPAGTTGVQPNCEPIVISDPASVLTSLTLKPKQRRLKAGKRMRMVVSGKVKPGLGGIFRVRLRSSNRQVRVPKVVRLRRTTGRTARVAFTVRATRRARGSARIVARAAGFKAVARVKVVKLKKKQPRRRAGKRR